MKFMLDTNICIYLIKQKPIQVIQHLQKYKPADIGISSITLSELEYGIEKSQHQEQNRIALLQFMTPFEIASYDESAACVYGKIRSTLEKQGQPIGAMDLLIAAHSIAMNTILVTNNEKEFVKVPGIQVQNWIK